MAAWVAVAGAPQTASASVRAPSPRYGRHTVPFELCDNLILMHVRVNGSRPLWFFFDTGASASVLNARVARDLGLVSKTHVRGGATGGSVEADILQGVTLGFAGLEARRQTVAAIDLDGLPPAIGHKVDGILGYGVIKQFVVAVDYWRRTISFASPNGKHGRERGSVVPIALGSGTPYVRVEAALPGQPPVHGVFKVDSGYNGALSMNAPFVTAHSLMQRAGRTVEKPGLGAGGSTRSRLARFEVARLGPFALQKPAVDLSNDTAGEEGSARYDGLLGGDFLRRFDVVLDYGRGRMILAPNAGYRAPFRRDASGLALLAKGPNLDHLTVFAVVPGSPASEASIHAGDVIIGADGRPASSLTMEAVRDALRRDGHTILLRVQGRNGVRRVRLRLRRLI